MSTITLPTPVQQLNIIRFLIQDDGQFPNNGKFPLLIYKHGITADETLIRDILESNRWVNSWKDSIFDYHHYHSTTHEVLIVLQGTASIQFGGPQGPVQSVEPGDVIIIPAGVAHKLDVADKNFQVVGAYPEGMKYDIKYGKTGERPQADENINSLPVPEFDPLYGLEGPLGKNWQL